MNDVTPLKTLTVRETADILKVSPKTLYQWINDDRFPPAFRLGGRIRVSVPALTEFLKAPPRA